MTSTGIRQSSWKKMTIFIYSLLNSMIKNLYKFNTFENYILVEKYVVWKTIGFGIFDFSHSINVSILYKMEFTVYPRVYPVEQSNNFFFKPWMNTIFTGVKIFINQSNKYWFIREETGITTVPYFFFNHSQNGNPCPLLSRESLLRHMINSVAILEIALLSCRV